MYSVRFYVLNRNGNFFQRSFREKNIGLFLQRFCGFVLGQSSYDVVFLSALAACSGENRLCKISRQSVLTLTLDSFKDKGTWWKWKTC